MNTTSLIQKKGRIRQKMNIALSIPISVLESMVLDIKEVDGKVTDIKNVNIKATKDYIAIAACATVNVLLVKQEINIVITLQLQVQSGNIICQNVSAKGDNFATTALVRMFEDTIMSNFNTMIKKGLDKVFVHSLDITANTIYISFSPQ